MFCPTAGGHCQGRAKCRLWIRGRILYTDSKQLAAQLARNLLETTKTQPLLIIPQEAREAFWASQGLPDIQREILIDRYLREKVTEVETLASEWIQSPAFLESMLQIHSEKIKESSEPRTPRCKSPP